MDIVTGSSGFLGRHLCKALKGKTETIPHELIYTTTIKPFERFFFLSTYGNLYHHRDIEKIIKANILDLVGVLKQAVKYKFKSFVYVSTSSVKLEIQTAYSRSKKAAEEILLLYMEQLRLPICIVRPLSITGVGEQEEHLIPTLIRSCMTGESVMLDKTPVHDFIDVEDVVAAIKNLSDNGLKGVFEIGTGHKYTNENVLRLVEKVTGKKANVKEVGKLRDYDNDKWVSNNFRARGWGWMPTKTLEQSIKEMVEDYVK